MERRRTIAIAGAIVAAVIVALLFLEPSLTLANAKSVPVESSAAKSGKSARNAGGATIQDVLPQLANPLSNLAPDVFASPAKKMQRLAALGDAFAAQLQAVRSGDPLLIAHSVYMATHCLDMPVLFYGKSAREVLTESSIDQKTGSKTTPDEALIAMHESTQSVGPLRINPPAELLEELSLGSSDTFNGADPRYYTLQAEIIKHSGASISATQRAEWAAVVERSSSECRGQAFGSDFGPEYRAALDRLVANGVVSAQLFNRRAGWQSRALGQLNERDFELIQRALTEWQPDGIARLLVGGNAAVGIMNHNGFPETDVNAASMLNFSLGPLAACALGVSNCSPDSPRFRSLCHSHGGCGQPDTAALLRHVFARDGLDPAIIDREINRVVDAFRARDLEALGIRRANEQQ